MRFVQEVREDVFKDSATNLCPLCLGQEYLPGSREAFKRPHSPETKKNESNAYYIRVDGTKNLEKLYHLFYDGVDESIYLTRKFNVLVEGLKVGQKVDFEQLTLDLLKKGGETA